MAKKKIVEESRLDELKRFGSMYGVEVMERELNTQLSQLPKSCKAL